MKKNLMSNKNFKTGLIVFFVMLIVGSLLYLFVFNKSKTLVCEASEGSITIKYNDKTLVGYNSVNFSFDLDAAKEEAEQIGVDEYIKRFSEWFGANSSGGCK